MTDTTAGAAAGATTTTAETTDVGDIPGLGPDGSLDASAALAEQSKAAMNLIAYQQGMIPIQTAVSMSQSMFSSISAISDKASQTAVR